MTQIYKKKERKRQASSGNKKALQKTFFTSFLTIVREMAKTTGKNTGKTC